MALLRGNRSAPPIAPLAAPIPVSEVPWVEDQQVIEAATPQAVPEPPTGQEIVVRAQNAVAAVMAGTPPVVNPFALLAEEGFEGLEDDGGLVFPVISLQNDARFMDNDKNDMGTELFVRVYGSKKKYVFRALTGGLVKDNKTDVAYSYDGVTTTRGSTIKEVQDRWLAEGKTVDAMKTYLDVNAQIYAPGAGNDMDFVVLSIGPASVRRFKQYAAQTRMRNGSLSSVVTRAYPGAKVTQGVSQAFYPWNFSVA